MYYIEKIKKHLLNWFEYAREHLIKIVFILFIVALLCYCLTFCTKVNILNDSNIIIEQKIIIFGITLDNWFTWISLIGLILTAIWAMYQFDKTTIRKQQEKAAYIAKRFSDDLLLKCEIVNIVYKKSPIYKLLDLKHLNYSYFSEFNTSELRNIYNDDNFPNVYQDLYKSINFDNIYFSLLKARVSIIDKKDTSKSKTTNKNRKTGEEAFSTEEAQKLFVLSNSNLPFHFDTLVDDVLNDLEQICMDISSQAAGYRYIYQSLHQVFLRTIRTLSIEISLRNSNLYSDKYYTNIIHVYKEWTEIYRRDLKREEKRKNKVHKILNPKIKTV